MATSFHMVIESNNDKAMTPGDIANLLRVIHGEILGCKTEGKITDCFGREVGEWSLDVEETV